ncbi:polyketide synthetase [Hysterangium stoloniferum]|nr:polyketide synthetase [Hysterangium stoloniferum]
MNQTSDTLLDIFIRLSTNSHSAEKDVVNCAGESWTYGDLHIISSQIASTIGQQHGPRPTMAVICENHPYLIVLFLAVWKLGGIVAPLDPHAPSDLIHAMLLNVTPTFVVIPASDFHNQRLVQGLGIPIEVINPENSTITALTQRFMHLSADVSSELYHPPQPENICLYIYTSSASSIYNLKCVPVTHGSIVANGHKQHKWLRENIPGLCLESLRALFYSHVSDVALGWDINGSCIDATFTLIDEKGDPTDTEGELCVSSRMICNGYLNSDSGAFTEDGHGLVNFRTGDIYRRTPDSKRLIWKGRIDDFIQLKSGESLDPRNVEKALNGCAAVAHCCVVGNTFSSSAADFVCAIIEITPDGAANIDSSMADISKALAAINRNLPPPLRIAWSRVLILDEDQHIPYTRKRIIFRKKLQALFGDRLLAFLNKSASVGKPQPHLQSVATTGFDRNGIVNIVLDIVSDVLHIPPSILQASSDSTFAELGMDSAMATTIINRLNQALRLSLPPNTCHTYIDVTSLTGFICELSISGPPPPPRPSQITDPGGKYYVNEPIAIVGQSMRLPGGIGDAESLWKALVERRKDILTATPPDRWDHASFQDSSSSTCEITFERSGFIDIASYDNAFFGIPAPEALYVSPTTRLVLETAFEALENANIPISKVKGTDMGVFVAAGLDSGYSELLQCEKGYGAFGRHYGTGIASSAACGRLSYLLDIHGPSLTVETACSGGLVALDQAVRHLQTGRGESAIVSGVNTHTSPGMFGFLSAQKMTSTSSRCATFTNEADGYATSEGVVSIIIKTQSAALRDGDNILGIIPATNTMHNGRTQGLVAPSSKVQAALQRSLLKLAALNPSDIDFFEAHGTGTSLGDLIEIQGINDVFHGSHTDSHPLIIGAAKSCIGHTETTSGLVGLIKTLLSFAKGAVPGLTHMNDTNINPAIECSIAPIHIPYDTVKLKCRNEVPLRALVVAYGFAGTNAGAIVESPPINANTMTLDTSESSPMIFVVSAKTQSALLTYVQTYLDFCNLAPENAFRSIFTVMSSPQLILGFPGQGSQFNGMANDLADRFSGFRAILTEYAQLATSFAGYPVLPLLLKRTGEQDKEIDQSEIAQLCIFVYQCAIVKWLESLGIQGQAVIGHSLGEIAAAVASRGIDYVDGLKFVIARADALKANNSNPGGMVAISASEAIILKYIRDLDITDHVVIAVFNGEENHVVSGAKFGIDLVYTRAKMDGIRCTKLRVDQGFHSPCIEASLLKLQNWLKNNEQVFKPLQVPFFSAVHAEKIFPNQCLGSDYWVEHAKNPVKFSQTVMKISHDKSLNPTMWTSLQDLGLSNKQLIATTGKHGKDQHLSFLNAIARLFESNIFVDLHKIYEQRGDVPPKTTVPTYPFQRQLHYPAFVYSRKTKLGLERVHIGSTPELADLLWTDQLLLDLLYDHRIEGRKVLPGAAFVDLLATLKSNTSRYVESLRFHQPLVLEELGILVQAALKSDGSFEVFAKNATGEQDRVCSGRLVSTPRSPPLKRPVVPDVPPIKVLNQEQVYQPFENNIHFGTAFRNITKLSVWADHVDALISITPSQNPNLDRIRKLDPCFHMWGALAEYLGVNYSVRSEGFFLPTSVEGFELYTENLPSILICRYYLPITTNNNLMSAAVSFDVLSPTGDLLLTCRNYAIAWLPKGIAIQAPAPSVSSNLWLINTWREEDIHILPASSKPLLGHDTIVVYASSTFNKNIVAPFAIGASEVVFLELGLSEKRFFKIASGELKDGYFPTKNDHLGSVNELDGKTISFVLDATCYSVPGSDSFSAFWKHAVWLMKLTTSGKIHTTGFVVVSSMSSPTTRTYPISPPGVSSVTQGILRVFRNESGLSRDVVWGLDVPNDLPGYILSELITREITIRRNDGEGCSSITAYRRVPDCKDESVARLVPVLIPATQNTTVEINLSGTVVIVGMGSIGYQLASHFMKAGCKGVIFMGRRAMDDLTVLKGLDSLKARVPGIIEYLQCDITDLSSVRLTLQLIHAQLGPIRNIVHTAGIVRDNTFYKLTEQEFERVLSPKVLGAWNLHLVGQEMDLDLDNFVVISSISVPLGNRGQAAYVGANAFLDTLVAYRQSLGLPGVSLQLGAWESYLVQNLDLTNSMVSVMSHDQGMPLIMKALTSPEPDPMYCELLVSVAAKSHEEPKVPDSKTVVEGKIIEILRDILEYGPDDELGWSCLLIIICAY